MCSLWPKRLSSNMATAIVYHQCQRRISTKLSFERTTHVREKLQRKTVCVQNKVNAVTSPCVQKAILCHSYPNNYAVRRAHFEGAPPRDPSGFSWLTEGEYDEVADETLESLADKFDALVEEGLTLQDYDVQLASGVLTIKLGGSLGTYVINKQTPNKQIWFSSPTSGPKRYDFTGGTWMYKHDGKSLHTRLTEEISTTLNCSVDFTECSYGKPER